MDNIKPKPYRPSNKCGIDFAWISVICVKPISLMASYVSVEMHLDKVAKEESERISVDKLLPGTVKMRQEKKANNYRKKEGGGERERKTKNWKMLN